MLFCRFLGTGECGGCAGLERSEDVTWALLLDSVLVPWAGGVASCDTSSPGTAGPEHLKDKAES